MADVFISYAKATKDAAKRIADALEAEGYDVWWDQELPPHRTYTEVIEEQVGLAKAVVVIWSPEAIASHWVGAEADLARNQSKLVQTTIAPEQLPPMPFNRIQTADLSQWRGEAGHREWEKVRASVSELVGRQQASQPTAAPKPSKRWPMGRALTLVALVAVAAGAACVAFWPRPPEHSPPPPPQPATAGLFAHPHPWTRDVSNLAKSERSDAIIAAIESAGGWGAGNHMRVDFGIFYVTAEPGAPRVTVNGTTTCAPDCDATPLDMPFPPAMLAPPPDEYACDVRNRVCQNLSVRDPAANRLYELYNARGDERGVTAEGVFVWDLGHAYGETLRGDRCTSADSVGLPVAALLVTADEVASGAVDHALRFTLPRDRIRPAYVRPATHAGGPSGADPDLPPYGARFRLRADFDETPYGPHQRTILRAMKTYGMILTDIGGMALTFGDDRGARTQWAELGIGARPFETIRVSDFEVVDLGQEYPASNDCLRVRPR